VTGDSGIVTADSGEPVKIGHDETESAVTFARNERSRSIGIVGHLRPEYARLSTIRLARMPEPKKVTLKSQLSAELRHVLAQRPELRVVKVADGAKDNWTYLSKEVPAGTELVDFFHAAEHLKKAFDTAYGENTPKAMAQFRKYRHILRHEESGVEKVIRALAYLHQCHPRRTKLTTELGYFRGHRHRMQYAAAKQKNLPIGSGVVEAACKTLATQRLKRSGMRWRHEGGQAILTFRALAQSERFDRAWSLLSETYKTPVSWPANTGLPPQAIAA